MSGPKMRKVKSGQGYGFVLDRGEPEQAETDYSGPLGDVRVTALTDDEDVVLWNMAQAAEAKVMGEGRKEHGPMDVLADPRDLLSEAIDEATDALTYLHMYRRQLDLKAAQAREIAEVEPYRLVYMAHPFGGDMRNLAKATGLLWKLREEYELTHNIQAPWISECQQFEDSDPEQRKRGLEKCKQLIRRCDELWLCGDRVSAGMEEERAFAESVGVKVVEMIGEVSRG